MKHISQLNDTWGIVVSYSGDLLAGAVIQAEIYDRIQSADLIIALASVDYLSSCKEEIQIIKRSSCYKRQRVVPVPIKTRLWNETFEGLMPSPRNPDFHRTPFDDSGTWDEVVFDLRNILASKKSIEYRSIPVLVARADSSSYEHPQTPIPDLPLNIKLEKNEIIIPIEGESMLPIYEEGDIAVGRSLEIGEITARMIAAKEVFAIRTKYNGTILKYIGTITDDEIVLSSENSVHKDISFHRSEIEAIFIITGDIKYRRRRQS